MSELPAFGENPPGTSNECNQIVKSVQQATTNFLEAITGLVQQSVRNPTSIPPTSIAASSAVTTGATSSNTGIASTSGLPFQNHSTYDSEDDFQSDSTFHLPTLCGRRFRRTTPTGRKRSRRVCTIDRTYTRTIVCLPHEAITMVSVGDGSAINIPRGKSRTDLFTSGLIGKIELSTKASEYEIKTQISDMFFDCFKSVVNTSMLEFEYLTMVPGLRLLQVPKVNFGFTWDGAAVKASSKGNLYILVHQKHSLKKKSTETASCNQELESCESSTPMTVEVTIPQNAPSRSVYNEYVTLLSSDEEDCDFQQALEASLELTSSLHRPDRSTQETTLQESLLAIKARIDPDSVTMLNVTRRRLLEGTLRALKRSNFNEAARISVKFGDDLGCSEGAVDAGGPTREFLRLAVSDVMQSEIFCGEEVARCLTKSGKANEKDHYLLYGRIIALSLIHGGPGPCCFSKLLYYQVVDLPRDYSLSLLESSVIHDQLMAIKSAPSEKEFLEAADAAKVLLETAGVECLQFHEKNAVVEKCLHFYLEGRISQELERFMKGLNCLGLLEEMKKCPSGFAELFLYQGDALTAGLLLDEIFTNIQRSERGSNSWMKESEIIAFWRDYVCDVEDGSSECKLQHILVFATGADRIPPLGFDPPPSIHFSKETAFPTANTCSNILTLPLIPLRNGSTMSYETFKQNMDFGILNSPGFGVA